MRWRTIGCGSVVCVIVLLGMIPVLGGEDGSDGVQEKDYVTTWGVAGTCAIHDGLNVGNACFALDHGEENVSIRIDDEFFETVRGMYRFFDGELGIDNDPTLLEEGFFCTDTAVDVPGNSDNLIVFVDGHIPTWFECDSLEGASIGSIVVTENP